MPSWPRQVDGERGPSGLLFFASAQDEPRVRRPTDIALVVVSLLLLVGSAVLYEIAADQEDAFGDLLASFPGFFDPLWLVMFWAPVAWAVVLLVVSVVRRRVALVRDMLAASAGAMALAALLGALVADDAWAAFEHFADATGPPSFPPGALTVATASISTVSPHVSRPFRHLGRWMIAGQLVSSAFLGATLPAGALVAVALGLLAAAAVHLVAGSPGGRPTTSRIRLALQGLGVQVEDLAPALMHPEGIVEFAGTDRDGPLAVKVYGRDAWDGQLLANIWRLAWYRDTQRSARLGSRIELVEHEAFVTLLAERAGVRVPQLVTAGSAGQGDALVVVRPDGVPLPARTGPVDDAAVASLWADLRRLHDAGITHRRLDLDRLVVRDDGAIGFGDLSSASVTDSPADLRADRAQALTVSILLVGEERAAPVARAALGDDGMLAALPYLQEAAMPTGVGAALKQAGIELDEVRGRLGTSLGAEEQPLIRLRRVTWGSVLNLALLTIAAFTLTSVFANVDWDSFVDELSDANWWWLLLALLVAQVARIPAAISTMGSLQQRLPLGPLTTLQFAICYVNLAIPSTAARVAVNVRFFERFGVRPATAMSAGVIDSVSGFVVQLTLLILLFFTSDIDFALTTEDADVDDLATIALIAIAAIVVLAVVTLTVAPVRRWLVDAYHQARTALRVLRSPTKVLQLFGGNLVAQVLFGVALAACVEAFGQEVSLSELVLINTVVSLFAGLLPIPGGIGVSEAGLTYGLTVAGLSSEVALAIAIAYRFASFYLPPIWGWFCYQWLVEKRYL
jgi:uncharacterized membrane protein YbhN (UPF0104 family)